jgi:hypothetical protein
MTIYTYEDESIYINNLHLPAPPPPHPSPSPLPHRPHYRKKPMFIFRI